MENCKKFILMINQAICTDGLVDHLLCPIKHCLNGVHISEVTKFLAENPSWTTHAIELVDLFDTTHPLIILPQFSIVTSYFDVYSPSIADYENEGIPKIHLTAKKELWDPSTSECSERETQMLNHQAQINFLSTSARAPVFVCTVFSYSLAYDAADVMDNDNHATALKAQIQISTVLIGMVIKPSIDPIVLAKRWGITLEKAQIFIQVATQRDIRTMLYHSLDMIFASTVSRRGNRCEQVYATDFK